MWIAGLGIAAIAWGSLIIIGGADSPIFPWLIIVLGIVALLSQDRWNGPRRRPGESGSVMEERHYFGDRRPHDRDSHR